MARMRERRANYVVRIESLNHKINRKAMIDRAIMFAYLDDNQYQLEKLEEYFDETLYTPVGGAVSRYFML